MESRLEKPVTIFTMLYNNIACFMVVIFGGQGLVAALGTEFFKALTLAFVAIFALAALWSRGRSLQRFKTTPIKAVGSLALTYLSIFILQWIFIDERLFASLIAILVVLTLVPWALQLSLRLDRYRLRRAV